MLLQGAYLPTMPEDSLPIARSAIGGAFYGELNNKMSNIVMSYQNVLEVILILYLRYDKMSIG